MTLTGNVDEFDHLINHALGWAGLLRGLRTCLTRLGERHNFTIDVHQVKEKFGGLRVYVSVHDAHGAELPHDDPHVRAVYATVGAAETIAELLCYLCGDGVTKRGSGYWVRYFCDRHDTYDLGAALAARDANAESSSRMEVNDDTT